MKKLVILSSVAVLTASLSAFAVDGLNRPERQERMQQKFAEADTNNDGVVTHSEMMAKVQSKFNEFDKNRDGFIELKELPKILPLSERRQQKMERHAERLKERAKANGRELPKDFDERFEQRRQPTRLKFVAKLDRDGDEKVSVEEFALRETRRFKMGDVNGDGNVTLAEMQEARKHFKGKRFKEKRGHRR